MDKVRHFKDLIVWQKSMAFVVNVYRVTRDFPKEEIYGLTSQIRRAAVSIPSNIAEGQARRTTGEFLQFLGHARGSLAEVETQLLISKELGYLADPQTLITQLSEISRILAGLISSLEA
jgi:four helix bundle protein